MRTGLGSGSVAIVALSSENIYAFLNKPATGLLDTDLRYAGWQPSGELSDVRHQTTQH